MNEDRQEAARPPGGDASAPVMARAEEAVDRALRFAGAFGSLAGRRLRHMAEQVRTEAEARAARLGAGEAGQSAPAASREPSPGTAAAGEGAAPVARAEETVDRIGQRVNETAAVAGLTIARLGARAREEAEDIWAEATDLRHRPGA